MGRSRREQYNRYMNSSAWKSKRRLALEQAGFRCAHCRTSKRLHVHHKSYEHFGREPLSDLMVLCSACHQQAHLPGLPAVITGTLRAPRRRTRRPFKRPRSKPPVGPVEVYYRDVRPSWDDRYAAPIFDNSGQ